MQIVSFSDLEVVFGLSGEGTSMWTIEIIIHICI